MNNFVKKMALGCALTTALLLAACNKEAVAPVATQTTTQAPTDAPKTYTAADFKTDGLSISEGKDYKKLASPQPVQVAGKIEIIEFFWYGCPHCYRLEPAVVAWKKTLPSDVNFIRTHVFWSKPMDEHQKIYYALSVLNKTEAMDSKVFDAIHKAGVRLDTPEAISAFMVNNGIDKAAWEAAYNGFTVNSEVAKANALFKTYELTGVPYFIVNGKYVVGGEDAHTLQVVNKLVEQERGKK